MGCPSLAVSVSDTTPKVRDALTITATPTDITPSAYNFFAIQGSVITFIAQQSSNAFAWTVSIEGSFDIYVLADDGTNSTHNVGGIAIVSAQPIFTFSVNTALAGSASDTFIIPLSSGGAHSGTINWGDGSTSVNSYANRSHTYASSGIYTITIDGVVSGFNFGNTGDKVKLLDISNWGQVTITSGYKAFQNCVSLNITATNAPIISTTTLEYMFENCDSLTTYDFSSWDTSGVTLMQSVFAYCALFNGDVSNFVHSGVERIKRIIRSCPQFNQDLSSWDVSGVTNWEEAFYGSGSFNGSVAGWTPQGSMGEVFQQAGSFTGIGVDSWDTSAVTSIFRMFADTAVFNGNVSGWNTSNITNANRAFYNSDSFDQDLSSWDINQVSNFTDFLKNSTGLSTANYDALLIAWDAQGAMSFSGTVNFGGSKYTSGGAAATARASLVTKWGAILDGGAA